MKITIKKNLCVVNTILSAIAYLLLHATVWMARSDINWLYLDESVALSIPALIATALAFWSIFWNPKNSKKWYIVSAALNAIPAIIFTALLAYHGRFEIDELRRIWRIIPAGILYFAVSAIYFAVAFTKTKVDENQDATIPYSE